MRKVNKIDQVIAIEVAGVRYIYVCVDCFTGAVCMFCPAGNADLGKECCAEFVSIYGYVQASVQRA